MAKELRHPDVVKVFESPPEIVPKPRLRTVRLPAKAFWLPKTLTKKGKPEKSKPGKAKAGKEKQPALPDEPYLILGFDTEFKTPDYAMERADVAAGHAKYRVLSYQFHAKTSDGREWTGICCPEGNDRMTLGAFIVFALGVGVEDYQFRDLPSKIYLVGHFTRADIPAFADFKDLTGYLSNVRNTFISIDTTTTVLIDHVRRATATKLRILFRDTLLLTPQASKSLKEIGKLVDCPKLTLDPDPATHQQMISNMDRVRSEHWDLFRNYAINDATICVRYIEKVIARFEEVTGSKKVPVTLTSIGIELLLKTWERNLIPPLDVLGKEEVEEKYYDKKKERFVKKKSEVNVEEMNWHIDFVTECYHGGRNEQFWFGPGFEDEWNDFDLSSAYPTAMSLIGLPRWKDIVEATDPALFTVTTLGFARVDFEFPPDTRFPTLPVRTPHGLVFPLKGHSYCSSPELVVALKLGAKVKIKRGLIVPTDSRIRIFGDFIKECLEKRNAAGSKTLQGLFWKEISNSTYGKTAQGLRAKRVYDMRDNTTKALPPSRITNPFFAAYITSFTRAVLGEIINGLKPDTCVFSCTTDGFLTNATETEIQAVQKNGDLCRVYEAARLDLTGIGSVLETKHTITQPLGWRTRGQATLKPGQAPGKDDSFNIILAKGGIYTRAEFETVSEQNGAITHLFFDRTPTSEIRVESFTGVRDMVNHDADLVEKVFSKRLNMEYDWKRKPSAVGVSPYHAHVLFNTQAWETVEHFNTARKAWEDYTREKGACLKSLEEYTTFAKFLEVQSFLSSDRAKYMKKSGQPDIVRLRQMLCSAWRQSKAGLTWMERGMSANDFAAVLRQHDIPCKKTDVENGRLRTFVPQDCPPTDEVKACLASLKRDFPSLKIQEFLFVEPPGRAIAILGENTCPFVERACREHQTEDQLAA